MSLMQVLMWSGICPYHTQSADADLLVRCNHLPSPVKMPSVIASMEVKDLQDLLCCNKMLRLLDLSSASDNSRTARGHRQR